jgi:hypothetical protein
MAENRVREKREILKSVKSYIGIGLGHIRPRIFLPTLLPLCVAHLMARSAHIPPTSREANCGSSSSATGP